MLTRYLAHLPEVDALKTIQKPNLASHFVHQHPQFGLRRDPESSKSFQEPHQFLLHRDRSITPNTVENSAAVPNGLMGFQNALNWLLKASRCR